MTTPKPLLLTLSKKTDPTTIRADLMRERVVLCPKDMNCHRFPTLVVRFVSLEFYSYLMVWPLTSQLLFSKKVISCCRLYQYMTSEDLRIVRGKRLTGQSSYLIFYLTYQALQLLRQWAMHACGLKCVNSTIVTP